MESTMSKLKLDPPYTILQAKKIMREALKAKKCKHAKLNVNVTDSPDVYNPRDKGRWVYNIECRNCKSELRATSDSPICENCSNISCLHFMQLESVKPGYFNLAGRILYFVCPHCNHKEDYEVLDYQP